MQLFSEDFTSLDSIYVPGETPATPKTCWVLQARNKDRATLVPGGLKLTTQPGDDHIAGSELMRRADLFECTPLTADPVLHGEGESMWFAQSVLYPDEFQPPRYHSYVVSDWHGTKPAKAANLHLNFRRIQGDDTAYGVPQIQGFYGDPLRPTEYYATLGTLRRNAWYDFFFHVRWSATRYGYLYAWLNGRLVLKHLGATMYKDDPVYFKAANYHQPVTQAEQDQLGWAPTPASSVVHGRIRLGATLEAVTA